MASGALMLTMASNEIGIVGGGGIVGVGGKSWLVPGG